MQGGNPYGQQGFGQPGFGGMKFDEDDSFIVGGGRGRRKKQDPNSTEIQREHGVFHEKLGSILGPAYIGGKNNESKHNLLPIKINYFINPRLTY